MKSEFYSSAGTNFSDALFGYIERSQLEFGKSFDRLLDAGTGTHSLRWIASLINNPNTESSQSPLFVQHYTAVTADETMRQNVLDEASKLNILDRGDVVIGNWGMPENAESEVESNDYFLKDQKFDTILADYLIGALDGFSPYYQDLILERLDRHLVPGGRMYIVGLQPIPDFVKSDANIACKVNKIRDACILLAGHRCYREYPVDWVIRHVQRIPHLNVVKISQFPILYTHATILRQLNVAKSKLSLFPSPTLATEMEKAISDLEEESLMLTQRSSTGKLKLGFDYVIVVEKSLDADDINTNECGEI